MPRFHTAILALALVAWIAAIAVVPPAAAGVDDDIEGVIADQIAAFQRNDLDAAFAHAAPGIQMKFGSAENFGHMVRHGYPMIWRPTRWEWRALKQTGEGLYTKTVLFEDASGMLYEADYRMGLTDGQWRIRGVELRKLPGISS